LKHDQGWHRAARCPENWRDSCTSFHKFL
jgi:hypothetical protein